MMKRTKLSLSFKMDIIKKCEENPSLPKKALAEYFKVPESTLKGILKKQEAIVAAYHECGIQSNKRSRVQRGKFNELENAVVQWVKESRSRNIVINMEMARAKAIQLSKDLEINNFSASYGWVEKLKKRHNLAINTIPDESNSLCEITVENGNTDLPNLIKGYKLKDIFSCNGTGLFYRVMPDSTLSFKEKSCYDKEKGEEILTVLLCCNADGSEKLPPLIISKLKKPRYFQNIKTLPCQYVKSQSGMMTLNIFFDFLQKFDRKMEKERRKVLLLMNPLYDQLDLPKLTSTKVLFFSENCTNMVQPLNPNIIRGLKVHYRKILVHRLITASKTKHETNYKDLNHVSLLDAIHMVCASWRSITDKSIKSSFKKAAFPLSFDNKSEELEDKNECFDNISEDEWQTVSDGLITFDEFVDVENNLITSIMKCDSISEEENAITSETNSDFVDEDKDIEKVPPTHTKALKAIETLRDYLYFKAGSEEIFSHLYEVEKAVFESSRQNQNNAFHHKVKQNVFETRRRKQKPSSIVRYSDTMISHNCV